jgi:hypothetical protein
VTSHFRNNHCPIESEKRDRLRRQWASPAIQGDVRTIPDEKAVNTDTVVLIMRCLWRMEKRRHISTKGRGRYGQMKRGKRGSEKE